MPSKLDQLIEAMPPLGELATKTLSELCKFWARGFIYQGP